MRKDAAANRAKLLAAGRVVFGERGLDATLNDVARAAGVGVGTAYRNFANKQELIEAIFETQAGELESILQRALACPDPLQGVEQYLSEATALQYRDKAMAQIFAGRFVSAAALDASRDRIAPLVNELGDRLGIPGTDLILVQVGVLAIADLVGDRYPRYLDIAIHGLRNAADTTPALTTDQLHHIMRDPDRPTGAAQVRPTQARHTTNPLTTKPTTMRTLS